MKNKIISILIIMSVLLSVVCVNAAELGQDIINETFDSGFGLWSKEGKPTIETIKGEKVVSLGEQETVSYAPTGNEQGWEDSYRVTFRLMTSDWGASGDPSMLFRIKSQGGSQVYLIYYSAKGFKIRRLSPTLAAKNLKDYSGAIAADGSKWHEIAIEAIQNEDKTTTIKVYFDGEKQTEVTDTETKEMPLKGGVMCGNWMKTNKVYLDSVRVQQIVVKGDNSLPDDPSPDAIGKAYEEDSTILRMLGIMDNYTDKLFKGDYVMTREEFVRCIISMLGLKDEAENIKEKCSFIDVSKEANGYIKLAEELGIINGNGNSMFEPDRVMKFEEGVKMLVCAFGYDLGDLSYPTGYMVKAHEIKLLKGISENDTTRGSMSVLLVNALNIPMNRIIFIGPGHYTLEKGETFLEERGIVLSEGIVTDDGITSYIGPSQLSENRVCIDHVQYDKGITSAEKYFGQKVLYYVLVEDDKNELLYVRPTDDNEVYTVDSKDILPTTTTGSFNFYDELSSKNRKLAISPICNFVYNGIAYPGILDAELRPADGQVTLIDYDYDKKFDTVIVSNYTTVIVDSLSKTLKTVYNKLPGSKGTVLDEDKKKVEIYKDGAKADFSKLKPGDVIKAEISKDDSFVRAIVSSEKFAGTLSGKQEDKVFINGEEYELCPNVSISTLEFGPFYSFSLDHRGKITYVEFNTSQNGLYGFLINAGKTKNKKNVEVEIFTSAGEFKIYCLAKNVKVNNTREKTDTFMTSSEIFDTTGEIKPQLITYQTDEDGFIKLIKTGTENPTGIDDMDMKTLSNHRYITHNRSFESKYFIQGSTIFFVPTDLTKRDYYRVARYSSLRHYGTYNPMIYNVKDNCPETVVLRVAASDGTESPRGSVVLVEKVLFSIDANGVERKLVRGIHNNEAVEYFVADGYNVTDVERGDTIQVLLNGANDIINHTVCVDENDVAYGDDGGILANTRHVTGKACKVFSGANRLAFNLPDSDGNITTIHSDSSLWAASPTRVPNIYMYDREEKKASVVTFNEIDIGCDIFMRMEQELIYDIVIYKN